MLHHGTFLLHGGLGISAKFPPASLESFKLTMSWNSKINNVVKQKH